ncbi:MAG: 30S ribosomal protein S4 [Patescibacteria group bacterium]|jgi:small subunit ribosomal protein S4
MVRITSSKNKLARREGVDLSLKTLGSKASAHLQKRLQVIPGQKQTKKRQSKLSDYGRQLREKQKLKRIYNLSERSMVHYYDKAMKMKGDTTQFIVQLLESRLDNVVYRLHFAPTRNAARQLVSHGHIAVNGKRLNIPSYSLAPKDVITFSKKVTPEIPYIKELLDEKNVVVPVWLKRSPAQGEVIGIIALADYAEPVSVPLVIEFYSKL